MSYSGAMDCLRDWFYLPCLLRCEPLRLCNESHMLWLLFLYIHMQTATKYMYSLIQQLLHMALSVCFRRGASHTTWLPKIVRTRAGALAVMKRFCYETIPEQSILSKNLPYNLVTTYTFEIWQVKLLLQYVLHMYLGIISYMVCTTTYVCT